MNTLIDPLKNGALALPGAHQLTLTGVIFAGEPSAEEFKGIVAMAETVDRVNAWLNGDVIVEYVRRSQHENHGLSVLTAQSEYAHAFGKQLDQVRTYYAVAKHYKHAERRAGLTWTHHQLLWSFGLGLRECSAWLKRADEQRWSVAQLRAEVKQAKRPAAAVEPTLHGLCPDWLRDAIDHASGCLSEVETMPLESAAALLNEAEPLAIYIDTLRARVATPTKESITVAL